MEARGAGAEPWHSAGTGATTGVRPATARLLAPVAVLALHSSTVIPPASWVVVGRVAGAKGRVGQARG